jgi:hypothetical protein
MPLGMRGEPCAESRPDRSRSVHDGMPLLRMEVGTLASGYGWMTGSASRHDLPASGS